MCRWSGKDLNITAAGSCEVGRTTGFVELVPNHQGGVGNCQFTPTENNSLFQLNLPIAGGQFSKADIQ